MLDLTKKGSIASEKLQSGNMNRLIILSLLITSTSCSTSPEHEKHIDNLSYAIEREEIRAQELAELGIEHSAMIHQEKAEEIRDDRRRAIAGGSWFDFLFELALGD